jgi:hypothetical protein
VATERQVKDGIDFIREFHELTRIENATDQTTLKRQDVLALFTEAKWQIN